MVDGIVAALQILQEIGQIGSFTSAMASPPLFNMGAHRGPSHRVDPEREPGLLRPVR